MKKIVLSIAVFGLVLGVAPSYADNKSDGDLHAPDHSGCRHATASTRSGTRATVFFEDFSAGIPATWTVIDNEGNGVVWTDMAGSGEGNYTSGSGDLASVSSDNAGSVDYDTELQMPALDLTNATGTALLFASNYANYANRDFFNVDVSTDGTNWTNVLSWNEDHGTLWTPPGEDVNIDLSAYDGLTGVIVRFHYFDPVANYDWYAQIDDVLVDATITQPPVEAIPTLSSLGTWALVLLLGLAAVFVIRWRIS